MRFFAGLRELMGWIFLGAGLAIFGLAGFMILGTPQPQLCSATSLTIIGFIIFRAGMHLIRLSVAGRVAADGRDGYNSQNMQKMQKTKVRPSLNQPSLANRAPNTLPGPVDK